MFVCVCLSGVDGELARMLGVCVAVIHMMFVCVVQMWLQNPSDVTTSFVSPEPVVARPSLQDSSLLAAIVLEMVRL